MRISLYSTFLLFRFGRKFGSFKIYFGNGSLKSRKTLLHIFLPQEFSAADAAGGHKTMKKGFVQESDSLSLTW